MPLSSVSIPSVPGFCSGSVPLVCRLFPLQPGYVMTVCAVAIAAQLNATVMLRKVIILPRLYSFVSARESFLPAQPSSTRLSSGRCPASGSFEDVQSHGFSAVEGKLTWT